MQQVSTEIINLPPRYKDRTGFVFGRLTVVGCVGVAGPKNAIWLCECSCGKLANATTKSLRHGTTKSCGCLRRETSAARMLKHGNRYRPEYGVWSTMLSRCRNPAVEYYRLYGGRGITVCERWLRFENFMEDMGPRPTEKHSIDRIDSEGNYEPSNCRWATASTQMRNMSRNRIVTFNEKSLCLTDWAAEIGINHSTLDYRIRKWGIAEALTRQPRRQ